MEKKNNCVKVGFSRILWAVLAIVLCAAPALHADETVPAGETWDIDKAVTGTLWVYGTANLLTGADIEWWVYATATSVVNIKGGTVGKWIDVAPGAKVTVYGTGFEVNGVPQSEVTVEVKKNDILTGYYVNSTTLFNLTFDCHPGATVTLAAPGGEPLEAQLWVFPGIINRYGSLSKIWAMVRLPEGITKGDIDSSRPLVLYANGYDDIEIKASCQRIVQWCRNGTVRTTIFASFDKASLTDVVPDGKVELEVVAGLNTGQDFYGTDTIRIVSWYWRPL